MASQFNIYSVLKNPEKKRKPLSNTRKRTYWTRLFYVLVILLSVLLQNTPHLFPTIMGCHAWLLIPLVVCIAIFEKDLSAVLLAALAGAFWDAALAWGDGFHALLFAVFASGIALLMNYLMRNNLKTALLLSGTALLFYSVLDWLIFSVARHVPGSGMLYVTFYLPSAAYSFLFTAVYYILLRKFLRKMREKYPRKEILEDHP